MKKQFDNSFKTQNDIIVKRKRIYDFSLENEKLKKISNIFRVNKIRYIMFLPVLLYILVFQIWPMTGMILAFQDYRIVGDNPWVGLKHFRTLFNSPAFFNVMKNTIIISSMKMILLFPVPVIVSLFITELKSEKFRKYTQSIIYLPHFLSWVVLAGIWIKLLAPAGGINQILSIFNLPEYNFMTEKGSIRWILVFSEMWRSAGWDSIVYVAALMRISPQLYEAAEIDGANKIKQLIYITLPELKTTIVTVFILNLGFFLNAGFDQVYNLMNDSVISVIDILDIYVYRIGLINGQYSFATAAGLFKGILGVIMILSTHFIAKKMTGKGVW